MRYPFGLLAGSSLALLLFALLAWLVVPPEAPEPLEEITLSLAELPAPVDDAPAEMLSAPAATATRLPPPPPMVTPPAPAPAADSAITLPDQELPPLEDPEVELDAPLPELTETPPEPELKPESKPKPKPEPKPTPEPEPTPQPAPRPSPPSFAEPVPASSPGAQPAVSSAPAASREPVDVGSSARPTRRVPPQYPSRAQRRGLEGHVVVQFLIRADGSVDTSSIEVLEARPRNVFEKAARQAIAGWHFETSEGLRRARQRLEFQLR